MRSIAVVLAVHYVVSAVHYVIPAKAGIQVLHALTKRQQTWVPAFAGTTI
jgi:hypothetical protein